MINISNWFGLNKPETPGDVMQFRLVELLIAVQVIIFSWNWGFYIEHFSKPAVPVGIAEQVNLTFLYHHQLALVNAGLITVVMLLGYFRKGGWTYFLALLLMHVQYAARFSQGKIGHGSVFTGLLLMALAISAVMFKHGSERRKVSAGLMVFFVGLAYDLAAFSKLIAAGIFWPSGSHLWLWIHERAIDLISAHGSYTYNILQHAVLTHYWLATLFLISGWSIEFCGFTFWFKKTRPYITTFLIMMHIGILFIMNIDFLPYMQILIVLGYPWSRLFDKYLESGNSNMLSRLASILVFPLSVPWNQRK